MNIKVDLHVLWDSSFNARGFLLSTGFYIEQNICTEHISATCGVISMYDV